MNLLQKLKEGNDVMRDIQTNFPDDFQLMHDLIAIRMKLEAHIAKERVQ